MDGGVGAASRLLPLSPRGRGGDKECAVPYTSLRSGRGLMQHSRSFVDTLGPVWSDRDIETFCSVAISVPSEFKLIPRPKLEKLLELLPGRTEGQLSALYDPIWLKWFPSKSQLGSGEIAQLFHAMVCGMYNEPLVQPDNNGELVAESQQEGSPAMEGYGPRGSRMLRPLAGIRARKRRRLEEEDADAPTGLDGAVEGSEAALSPSGESGAVPGDSRGLPPFEVGGESLHPLQRLSESKTQNWSNRKKRKWRMSMSNSPLRFPGSHLVRRWAACEFETTPAEAEWLSQNCFESCLAELGLQDVHKLSRMEWSFVRMAMGPPRRLSRAFLDEERAQLAEIGRSYAQTGARTSALRRSESSSLPSVVVVARFLQLLHAKSKLLERLSDLNDARQPYSPEFVARYNMVVRYVDCLNFFLNQTEDSLKAQMSRHERSAPGACARYAYEECIAEARQLSWERARAGDYDGLPEAQAALLRAAFTLVVALRWAAVRRLDGVESVELCELALEDLKSCLIGRDNDAFVDKIVRVALRMMSRDGVC